MQKSAASFNSKNKRVRYNEVSETEMKKLAQPETVDQVRVGKRGSASQGVINLSISREVKREGPTSAKRADGSYVSFDPKAKKTTTGYEQAEIKFNMFANEQSVSKAFKIPQLRKIPLKDLNGQGDCRLSATQLLPEFCSFMMVRVRFQGDSDTAKEGGLKISVGSMLQHLSGVKTILVKIHKNQIDVLQDDSCWYSDLRRGLEMRSSVKKMRNGEKVVKQLFGIYDVLAGRVCKYLFSLGTVDSICKAAVIATQRQAVGRGGEVAVSTWSDAYWDDTNSVFVSCWKELKTGHDYPMIYCFDNSRWELDVLVLWASMLIINPNGNDRGK